MCLLAVARLRAGPEEAAGFQSWGARNRNNPNNQNNNRGCRVCVWASYVSGPVGAVPPR